MKKTKKKKRVPKKSTSKNMPGPAKESPPEVHRWRLCPYGRHLVVTHPMHVPPSQANPEGSVTTRHEHCADNPSKKDELYPPEIQDVAARNFAALKGKPCPLDLGYPNGGKYDDLIAGWVQYWNDVLKSDEPLDPNLVKALIATGSGFSPGLMANKKNSNSARGLMQITNDTRKILGGFHGDIKDHFLTVTKDELNDPNTNICAGVRWLFEKRRLLSARLGEPASWLDTIWNYKGLTPTTPKEQVKRIKAKFNKFYEDLKTCGKN